MSSLHPSNKSYWLSKLCESNYAKMLELIPDLQRIERSATALVEGKPALHMRVLERCPYTVTLELTHSFAAGFGDLFEPAVQIRVYLDACVVEVLSDHDRPSVVFALERHPEPRQVLDYKWQLNYFLSRWLDHCAQNAYQFVPSDESSELTAAMA
jgi:uncharacterized protein YqiB (DUF1249 family)